MPTTSYSLRRKNPSARQMKFSKPACERGCRCARMGRACAHSRVDLRPARAGRHPHGPARGAAGLLESRRQRIVCAGDSGCDDIWPRDAEFLRAGAADSRAADPSQRCLSFEHTRRNINEHSNCDVVKSRKFASRSTAAFLLVMCASAGAHLTMRGLVGSPARVHARDDSSAIAAPTAPPVS